MDPQTRTIWTLAVLSFVAIIVASFAGFKLGRMSRKQDEEDSKLESYSHAQPHSVFRFSQLQNPNEWPTGVETDESYTRLMKLADDDPEEFMRIMNGKAQIVKVEP